VNKGENTSTAKYKDDMRLVLLMRSSEKEETLFTQREIPQQSETWCLSEVAHFKNFTT
jgi:hypothetical protein